MRTRKAEVPLYAEAIGKPYRGDLRQAEASKLGTAETKVGEAEQGVAVIGKLGREPCRLTHRVEQLDHRHRVRRGLPVAVGCAPRDVICAQGVAEFRSEEHTSELQSLMRISYAVFFLKKKKNKKILYDKLLWFTFSSSAYTYASA